MTNVLLSCAESAQRQDASIMQDEVSENLHTQTSAQFLFFMSQ